MTVLTLFFIGFFPLYPSSDPSNSLPFNLPKTTPNLDPSHSTSKLPISQQNSNPSTPWNDKKIVMDYTQFRFASPIYQIAISPCSSSSTHSLLAIRHAYTISILKVQYLFPPQIASSTILNSDNQLLQVDLVDYFHSQDEFMEFCWSPFWEEGIWSTSSGAFGIWTKESSSRVLYDPELELDVKYDVNDEWTQLGYTSSPREWYYVDKRRLSLLTYEVRASRSIDIL